MYKHLKQFMTIITIIAYTNMVFAEDLQRDVPSKQKFEFCLKAWNDSLVNDFDDWESYNKDKGIELINQNNTDPLFGLDL